MMERSLYSHEIKCLICLGEEAENSIYRSTWNCCEPDTVFPSEVLIAVSFSMFIIMPLYFCLLIHKESNLERKMTDGIPIQAVVISRKFTKKGRYRWGDTYTHTFAVVVEFTNTHLAKVIRNVKVSHRVHFDTLSVGSIVTIYHLSEYPKSALIPDKTPRCQNIFLCFCLAVSIVYLLGLFVYTVSQMFADFRLGLLRMTMLILCLLPVTILLSWWLASNDYMKDENDVLHSSSEGQDTTNEDLNMPKGETEFTRMAGQSLVT